MNRNLLLIIVLASLFLASCIARKDLVYLQKTEPSQKELGVETLPIKPYRFQIGDLLIVTIKSDKPEFVNIFNSTNQSSLATSESSLYFTGYRVDEHGNIRIPLLGDVNTIGFSEEELRQQIEKLLMDNYFKKEANIFVSVRLAGFKYTINGEVGAVGTKILYQDRVNIMEAIANAGDIKLTGDRRAVIIIRQLPTGTQMHEINLLDANVLNSPYFYLQPNDYIYVKPLRQKTLGTGGTVVESLASIVSVLSLVTTALVLFQL